MGLAAITGRPIRIEKVRAVRLKPGLGAQYLTAVRAVAAVCGAELSGDSLGSPILEFRPRHRPRSADYEFDVAEAREGRSAGAATLVLQAVLAPFSTDIVPERLRAACPGAGIFLTAEYEGVRCGFNAIGRIGKPAEAVADEAVDALLRQHSSPAVVDEHLGDQLLVPYALASGTSTLVVDTVSPHLQTNAWVIEQFGLARVEMARHDTGAMLVTVAPTSTR